METKVVNYLKSKGVSTLDVVVATHPDADHIGGLIPVLIISKSISLSIAGKYIQLKHISDLLHTD